MAGDREKTAGQAAKEKVERRRALKKAAEAPGDGAGRRSSQESEKDLEAPTAEPNGSTPTESGKASSSEELRAEVEEAPEQLATSVEELTDRIDPRPKIEGARRSAVDNAAPIGVALALALVLIIWRRRRR